MIRGHDLAHVDMRVRRGIAACQQHKVPNSTVGETAPLRVLLSIDCGTVKKESKDTDKSANKCFYIIRLLATSQIT